MIGATYAQFGKNSRSFSSFSLSAVSLILSDHLGGGFPFMVLWPYIGLYLSCSGMYSYNKFCLDQIVGGQGKDKNSEIYSTLVRPQLPQLEKILLQDFRPPWILTDAAVAVVTVGMLGVWGIRMEERKKGAFPLLSLSVRDPLLKTELESFSWGFFCPCQCSLLDWIGSRLGDTRGKQNGKLITGSLIL